MICLACSATETSYNIEIMFAASSDKMHPKRYDKGFEPLLCISTQQGFSRRGPIIKNMVCHMFCHIYHYVVVIIQTPAGSGSLACSEKYKIQE